MAKEGRLHEKNEVANLVDKRRSRGNGRITAHDDLPNTKRFAVPPGRALQGVSGLARQQAGFKIPRDCQGILEEDFG